MELYKVILADDEEGVRKSIINRIEWQQNGFEIVGDAENGEEALELAEALRPDLIITDIKMPYLGGLELLQRLQSVLPSAKTVIITGFDDFEYAKSAISLNVVNYMLKPINVEEFTAMLQKVRQVMDEENEMRRDLERLRNHFNESLPILRERFIISLLEGRISHEREKALSSAYGLDLNGNLYAVACLRCDAGAITQDNERLGLIQLSVRKLCEEALSKYAQAHVLIYTDYIVAVMALQEPSNIDQVMIALNDVCAQAAKYYDFTVSAGIGYLCQHPSMLSSSYKGAVAALDYRMLFGAGQVIFIEDIEPNASFEVTLNATDEERLLSAIRFSEVEEIEKVVKSLLMRCADGKIPYNHYQVYLAEILTAVLRIARSFSIDVDTAFGSDFDILRAILEFESAKQLGDWLTRVCIKVSKGIGRERQNTSARLLRDAMEYTQKHYMDCEFSVDKMCSELHVSPSYFSTLFKRAQGKSFVNYLTQLRMNEAIRLLTETDERTYIIAEKIGLVDPNYFSFVFKKYFGVSPTKYRNSLA